MSLDHEEREALAGICDDLQRADPELARSLRGLGRPSRWRWWVGLVLAVAGGALAVGMLGLRGVGIVDVILVLGAPLSLVWTLPAPAGPADGPPDPAV